MNIEDHILDISEEEEKEKIVQLISFGFTKLQAKIYLATCILGPSSVKEIMGHCEMHKVEVYRVLYELEKNSILDRILGHPVRFKCKPPREVLSAMILPHIKNLSKINSEKDELEEWLNQLTKNGKEKNIVGKEGFQIYRGKLALKKMIEMLNNASNDIMLSGKASLFDEALENGVLDALNKSIINGVNLRGALNVQPSDIKMVKMFPIGKNIERRHSDKIHSWMMIVDNEEIIFSSAPKALPDEEFIYSGNKRFISNYVKALDILWNDSIPIDERMQELEAELKGTPEIISS